MKRMERSAEMIRDQYSKTPNWKVPGSDGIQDFGILKSDISVQRMRDKWTKC